MKENKGITLIALVITIIVMLILAGVEIAALTTDNGIIGEAKKAGDKYNQAATNEASEIQVLLNKLEEYQNGTPIQPINPNLQIGEVVTKTQTFNKKTVGTYSNPLIPKGFAPINENGANWGGVNGYTKGLVIEDRTGDKVTNLSQFVWIPVQDFSQFKRQRYNTSNGIWTDLTADTSWREAYPTQTTPILKEPIKTEITEMYKSVQDNGGFYVARFEAGVPTKENIVTTANHNTVTNGTVKPVSKKNYGTWNFIPWGGTQAIEASDGYAGNDYSDGAVKVARAMYPNGNATGVTSTLMYSVQWDAIMKFMENFNNPNVSGKKYIQDSTGMGNCQTVTLKTTGAYETYRVNNIYDLAGNCWECTMESASSTERTLRGGDCNNSASGFPVSSRSCILPENAGRVTFSFRTALYL